MQVFLDANVIFSACNSGSAIGQLFEFISTRYKLLSCNYAVEEAERNLANKKPDWLGNLARIINQIEVKADREFYIEVETNDKDRIILTSAIYYGCEILITGDKRHSAIFIIRQYMVLKYFPRQ